MVRDEVGGLADLTYALCAGGVNFVIDFITGQERWFRVLAGVILLFFGLGVFRSNR